MREVESCVWLVQFSEAVEREGGKPWNRNVDLTVVAPSMQAALDGVREVHPTANFHAAHRRGTGKTLFVVDSASADA